MANKVEKIIESLKDLTLMEASDLVKAIEETFDVSASAPVAAVAAAPVAGAAAAEEKTEFDVKVTGYDDSKKISVIKVVKKYMLAPDGLKVGDTPDLAINIDESDFLSGKKGTVTVKLINKGIFIPPPYF